MEKSEQLWKSQLTEPERRQLEKLEAAASVTNEALRDLIRTLKSRCESRLRQQRDR